jgi:methylmalonyl-CoA/ethylmalonyl-CoA epimerase
VSAVPRLAHLAVIVRDRGGETALPVSALGLAVRERTAVPAEDVAVAFVPVGSADVELIEPLSEDGPLARFLAARGEGLHHIALAVPDVEAALAQAAAAGIRVAGPGPRPGARGTRVAFLHPASLHGLLVELVQQ